MQVEGAMVEEKSVSLEGWNPNRRGRRQGCIGLFLHCEGATEVDLSLATPAPSVIGFVCKR